MNNDKKELIRLLEKTTETKKHKAYQILSSRVATALGDTGITFYPKYEKERLAYISNKVAFKDMTVLDIGCNTGYFLFEALELGAKEIIGYEGGRYHSAFVAGAAELIGAGNQVKIIDNYYTFEADKNHYDIVLLLNVLHHLGDDYDNSSLSMESAKRKMIDQLNSMSKRASTLVYQMGFNWKGDINQCLFDNGTKAEMIEFIKKGIKEHWRIVAIGIAEGTKQDAEYHDLSERNIARDDSLGEFLNRPIFILKSLGAGSESA